MFQTAIILLVLCTVVFKVNSLQCYACYDCDKLSDDVKSCDSLLPNTTTTSTVQPTSTISSTTTPKTTNSTTPSTNSSTESTTAKAPQLSVSHFADTERANTTWECFKGTLSVNGSDVIVRGCAAGRTNETCEPFGLKSCSFCSTDKCNVAGSIQASAAVLAVMLITYLVKEC